MDNRKGVVVTMPSTLPQIAIYVPPEVKAELLDMCEHNRRLSLSNLGAEAFEIAMSELRKRYGGSIGRSPVRERASRRKYSAV